MTWSPPSALLRPVRPCSVVPWRNGWPTGAAETNNRNLTAREIEILRHVAEGNTNAATAEQLHISEATVKTHLVHIYDKLGVSDRAAAVARGYETSILTP